MRALIGIGALIDENTFEGGAYSEGGAYWKEGAKSSHYGTWHSFFTKIYKTSFYAEGKNTNLQITKKLPLQPPTFFCLKLFSK